MMTHYDTPILLAFFAVLTQITIVEKALGMKIHMKGNSLKKGAINLYV